MSDLDELSGERFVPESMGDQLIEAEHQARYRHAVQLVRGRTVLDAGCGVGWGSVLLADAGAARVTGLDIDPGALENARRRAPVASFVRGDLGALPFDDGAFEVVVCFEAIEHVGDPLVALDELRRVLTPGGVLTVSSPNPEVYPPGNPFHVHEFTPAELGRELARRFAHTVALGQHAMLSSVVRTDGVPDAPWEVVTLAELSMQRATYSVFDASDAPLEATTPLVTLVSGRQFHELAEEVGRRAALEGSNGAAVSADVLALARERDHYRIELDRTLRLLLDAEQEVARLRGGGDR